MTQHIPIRVGLMGFGQIGRQLYRLAAASGDIEIVAIADIGEPRILHYLLCAEADVADTFTLEGNFLVNPAFRTRMLPIDRPAEMPWDVLGVDVVVDATGIYRARSHMADHLDNGAGRVILRSLPADGVDRIVIPGVNSDSAEAADRMVSAGSSTTSALCLLLDSLSRRFPIDCASMTTVHAYTSDQALQDYAGSDYRRSRSAAENIIPNTHEAGNWLAEILPAFEGRVMTWALNVPIHRGCLLDVNLVLGDAAVTVDMVNDAMRDAATRSPGIIGVEEDPIVSSDVIGSSLSLLYDLRGTIKAGDTIIKTLSWYENRGHAARILDVVRLYADLDRQAEAA